MSRKNSKQYSKEYNSLLTKTKALEIRIKKRTLEMCANHPDAPVGEIMRAEEFHSCIVNDDCDFTVDVFLQILKKIEEYNEKKSGHVQTKMF